MAFMRRKMPAPQQDPANHRQSSVSWEFGGGESFDSAPGQKQGNRRAGVIAAEVVYGDGGRPEWAVDDDDHDEAPFAENALLRPSRADPRGRHSGAQRSLEEALVTWWSDGRLPGQAILRDGLLMLQAGHHVEESHRSLLLRTALHHRRGVLTALKHQTDPERTALIMREALLDPMTPLPFNELARLVAEDSGGPHWAHFLDQELQMVMRSPDPARAALAEAALAALSATDEQRRSARRFTLKALQDGWIQTLLRLGGFVLLGVLVAALLGWVALLRLPAHVVSVPAGDYTLFNPDSTTRTVTLSAFSIQRFEATNADYGRCAARGRCLAPTTASSATRSRYYDDPVFGEYPLVNVPYAAAVTYCSWQGGRLPTESEWQVAAGYAPALGRSYRYPWGDRFELGRANTAGVEVGDTLQVGHYQPAGDSPLGLSDGAGNVAEWTMTAAPDQPDSYVVKGGSFVDAAEDLQNQARRSVAAADAQPWLGVRCVFSPRWFWP